MKLDSLLAQIGKTAAQKIPPVEKWNPPLSGDIDIEIKSDGSWWHEGDQIRRQELVNIFASILKHEEGSYYLVTPVEKWRIRVQDRPLHISMVSVHENDIEVITTTADNLVLGLANPLKMSLLNGILLPEVKIRHDLWARFTRNAWYELLQFATENDKGQIIITSQGQAFDLSSER